MDLLNSYNYVFQLNYHGGALSSLSESESDSFMEVFTGRRVVELGAVGGGRVGMPGCNDCVLFLNIVFCIFITKH